MNDEPLTSDIAWPRTGADTERLRDALDRIRLGFQVISFEWEYLYVNPAAARHGGRTPKELVGRRVDEIYPGIRDTPLFQRLQRCMEERSTASFLNTFTYPDGSQRRFEIRVQPVPEGVCIYSEDVEARERMETLG